MCESLNFPFNDSRQEARSESRAEPGMPALYTYHWPVATGVPRVHGVSSSKLRSDTFLWMALHGMPTREFSILPDSELETDPKI